MANYISSIQVAEKNKCMEELQHLLCALIMGCSSAIATKLETAEYKRYLYKAGDNNGFIVENFENKIIAGSKLM